MPYLRVYEDDSLQEQIEITDKPVSIGRLPENDIVLENPGVSSCHAVIEARETGLVIVDQDSTNGVYVNKKRVKVEQPLSFHDEIQISSYVLKYMPTSRLSAREKNEAVDTTAPMTHDETMAISIQKTEDLERLRRKNKTPYLQPEGNTDGYKLSSIRVTLGKDTRADIRINGWFAPKQAAILVREQKSYHLIPCKRGKVLVNDNRIASKTPLSPGDRVNVRGRTFVYLEKSDMETQGKP